MSLKGIEALQRGVGRDTVVILQGGQCFNDHLIGDDGNCGINNRLLGEGGDNTMTVAASGMKNRLYQMYENLTADFVSETKYGPSAAVLMLQSAISATRLAVVDLTHSNGAVGPTKGEEAAEVGVVTARNGNI